MVQTTRTADDTAAGAAGAATFRLMGRAFAVLRIVTGLVFLSNALAKVSGVGNYDWGFFSFNLITGDAAKSIATNASGKTHIAPLGAFYATSCSRTGASSGSSSPWPSSPSGSG